MAVFLIVGLRHLDAVPQVYEDEPWQASTAFLLATKGVFGSELFSGYYGMEQRYYGFMPLHPLLMAGIFRLAGVALAQARQETVALSTLTLVLTFLAGTRLFRNAWIGAIAVVILVGVRWTGLTYVQLSGIPLVDFARIARYDPLVPVAGLLALHAFWSRWYLAAGVLAGLSGLAHVYGLFWVPALALLTFLEARWRRALLVVAGAVLPWLPYAAYVASDLQDWRGQTAVYATRFELLNPAWYLDNLVQEYHRYGPGLGPPGLGWLLHPGAFALAVALPVSLWLLARCARRSRAARTLLVPSLLFPLLFALFIHLKLVNYTLIELPLWALAIGYALVRVTRFRVLVAVVGAAVLLEGAAALVNLDRAAETTTPYPQFIAEVRPLVPPNARVLGLHTYWFGMENFDYRSFLVPLNWADEGVPLDQALDRVAPQVVLLDPRMRTYFTSVPDGALFNAWLGKHNAVLLGRVDDPTYGLIEIYRLSR